MHRRRGDGRTQSADLGRFCSPIPEQLAIGTRPPPFIIDAAAADMIVDRLGEAVDAALEGVPPSGPEDSNRCRNVLQWG